MRHRRLLFLFAVPFIFAAVCINLSWIQERHDADLLLTSLISIERWTPYYWGDNRYGSLLPLLASAIGDYSTNLLVQTQLSVAAAIATAILFQCFFLERPHGFTVRNLSAASITILIAMLVFRPNERVVRVFLLPHPYFTSLSLGLIGLIALLRYQRAPLLRYTIAIVALLLSFWVTWTNGPIVIGLMLLLPSGNPTLRQHLRARLPGLSIVCACLAIMFSVSLLYPRLVVSGLATVSEIPKTLGIMLANVSADMVYPIRFAAVIVIAVASLIGKRRTKMKESWSASDGLVILTLSVGFALAISSTDWVIRNLYEWRYWTVPLILTFLTIASVAADWIYISLHRVTGSTATSAIVSLLVFLASIIHIFGLPSAKAARSRIEAVSGVYYDKVVRLRCTHMIGNYWIAWSSVFYNRARNIQPPLWAVSLRSEVTEDRWSKMTPQERRYCGVCGDTMNNYYEIVFKLGPLRHTDQTDGICLYQK